MNREEILKKMAESIVLGQREDAKRLAEDAVAGRMDLNEVIDKGFVPGIQKVGDLWESGDYFLPELISSAESMKAAMAVLQPALAEARIQARSEGRVVIGTIEGDIHDIGKNLVASMLGANGFDVIDLGADVKLERFLEEAENRDADFICLSALLTTTMLGQKRFIELLERKNIRRRFRVLVGGAPVTRKWAEDIGADGYAENALAAVRLAKEMMKS